MAEFFIYEKSDVVSKFGQKFEILILIYSFLSKFEIWPFWGFSTSADFLWPRDTFSQKADVKSVILIYNSLPFDDVQNWTLNDPKFVIWPQTQIFSEDWK